MLCISLDLAVPPPPPTPTMGGAQPDQSTQPTASAHEVEDVEESFQDGLEVPPPEAQEPNEKKEADAKESNILLIIIISVTVILFIFIIIFIIFYLKKKGQIQPGAAQGRESIKNYIKNYMDKGYNVEQIKQSLMQQGWTAEQIQQAFNEL